MTNRKVLVYNIHCKTGRNDWTGLEATLFVSLESNTMAIMLAVHSTAANVTAMQQQKCTDVRR